jgi:nucleoside-diphosphate-sugar epimerase
MRVLVTGAQGCIGAWAVKKLLDRGIDVVAFDVDPEPRRLSLIADAQAIRRLACVTGEVTDTAQVKRLIRDGGITHVVHLAGQQIPYCQQNPVSGGVVNIIGTLNVFEAARDAERPVRVVYASSAAVWGPEEAYGSGKLREEDPLKPATHYGIFKQANEGNARVFYAANGISSIGLRPWSVYGVGRDKGLTADPTLAMRAAALRTNYHMRLTGYIDLQYVEDVAEVFIACLLSDLQGAHVYNLAGDVVRIEEIISLLDRLRPGSSELLSAEGPQVPVAFRMDDSQLRSHIQALPHTPLEEGARRTVELFERLHSEGRV